MSMGTSLPAPASARDVPSWRLLVTLGFAGAMAGLLIVLTYIWTQPSIRAHQASVLRDAIQEVLHAPERADTLWVRNGALTAERPPAPEAAKAERLYRGYAAGGATAGYAIATTEAGFADPVSILFGYDPVKHEVLGLRILSSKETPGLGDKIQRPAFTGQFAGRRAPITGVKTETARAADPSAIVMITGATISSRAVIREIDNAVARWQPLIDALEARERGRR